MNNWILSQFQEGPGFSDIKYAFTGTVHWMRALAIIINSSDFETQKIQEKYEGIVRKPKNPSQELFVFENLIMAYHNHVALVRNLELNSQPYDTCRSAIVSWYYSIYFSSSAMIAAKTGTKQETHATTAKVWKNQLVDNGLIMSPFSFSLNSLVKNKVALEIANLRGSNQNNLSVMPYSVEQAKGAIFSYLNGSADYEKKKWEAEIKNSKDFKALGVSDFRKRPAQEIRDRLLDKKTVSFLHQAFRYRGKVNYRDSLFLTYGEDNTNDVIQLVEDLKTVSEAFQRMSAGYIKAKINKDSWDLFYDDLTENSRLSVTPGYFFGE